MFARHAFLTFSLPGNRVWTTSFLQLLFTLIGISLCCTLAIWQLQRGEFKKQLQMAYESPPSSYTSEILYSHPQWQALHFSKLKVSGKFINTQNILVDNKFYQGRLGYEVLTPLLLPENHILLISRGWIPFVYPREKLPTLHPIEGKVTLQGRIDIPNQNRFISSHLPESEKRWPLRIAQVNFEVLSEFFSQPIVPLLLKLENQSPYAYQQSPPEWGISYKRHHGYAFQWFALALTLGILFIFLNIKERKERNDNDFRTPS